MDDKVQQGGVAFVTIGHAGQSNALLAIAQAFHRAQPDTPIAFITSHDLEKRVKVALPSATFVGLWRTSKFPSDMVAYFNESGVRSVEAIRRYTVWTRGQDNYVEPLAQLSSWMTKHRPELVVCDVLSEAGMSAALATQTPYIINSPLPPYTCFPECLPTIFPPIGSGLSAYKRDWWHAVCDFCVGLPYALGLLRTVVPVVEQQFVERGIPRPEHFARQSVAFLNDTSSLLSHPRVRWPAEDDASRRLQWIGACIDEEHVRLGERDGFDEAWQRARNDASEDPQGLLAWVDDGADEEEAPLVLVALGTLYTLDATRVRAIYDALQSLPIRVIWKLSVEEQAFLPAGALENANIRIQAWLPDLLLLIAHPSLRLFVNHAGGNSLHEGLLFGKPMVCLPGWMDCFDFAMRCQDAGAGLSIDTSPRLDGAQLRDAMQRVLFSDEAPQFRANAQRIGRDLKQLGGARQAAHVIAQTLQHRHKESRCT